MAEEKSIWRGLWPMLGHMVGVGLFGVPFAFAQVGLGMGTLEFVVVGALNTVGVLIFADLVAVRGGHARFAKVIGGELGVFGEILAGMAIIAAMWGALLAYILVGGTFAYTILNPWIGGSVTAYQYLFFAMGLVLTMGGPFFVARVQRVILPLFAIMVVALLVMAYPHVDFSHYTTFHPENVALPLGVFLFALGGGVTAIPEVRDVIGRRTRQLPKIIVLGPVVVSVLYLLFTIAILGLSGTSTAPEALTGIAAIAGRPIMLLGSLMGLLIVFNAFVTQTNALANLFVWDAKMRFIPAWLLAIGMPCALLVSGATNFIDVVGYTGGILGGICGILIVVAYERARMSAELPKRALAMPQFLVVMTFVMFVGMIVATVAG